MRNVFLCFVLFGCFVFGAKIEQSEIDINLIIDLKKDKVIEKLGKKYKNIDMGAEMSYQGFFYEQYGMTIVFDDEEYIDFIECNYNFQIKKINPGMEFKKIMKVLGERKVSKTYIEPIGETIFWIKYAYGNYSCIFESHKKTGNNSELTIYRTKMLPEIYE